MQFSKKNLTRFFFLSAIFDVEGVKTSLRVEGAEHISSNISKILCKLMKLVFFDDKFNGVYPFV